MTDSQILNLYDTNPEEATEALQLQYYGLCYAVACRVLQNHEDAQECVNDVLYRCVARMPKDKPRSIPAYLRVMTRNQALDIWRRKNALYRGGGQQGLEFQNWNEDSGENLSQTVCDCVVIRQCLHHCLDRRSREERELFLRRYRDEESITQLSREFSLTESCVKQRLMRMRRALREDFVQNGLEV